MKLAAWCSVLEEHSAAFRRVLNGSAAALAVVPDTSDMDLTPFIRASALWSLCNRDLS